MLGALIRAWSGVGRDPLGNCPRKCERPRVLSERVISQSGVHRKSINEVAEAAAGDETHRPRAVKAHAAHDRLEGMSMFGRPPECVPSKAQRRISCLSKEIRISSVWELRGYGCSWWSRADLQSDALHSSTNRLSKVLLVSQGCDLIHQDDEQRF
jgi:hypothetical protein